MIETTWNEKKKIRDHLEVTCDEILGCHDLALCHFAKCHLV
jgi:hypothetical protein